MLFLWRIWSIFLVWALVFDILPVVGRCLMEAEVLEVGSERGVGDAVLHDQGVSSFDPLVVS